MFSYNHKSSSSRSQPVSQPASLDSSKTAVLVLCLELATSLAAPYLPVDRDPPPRGVQLVRLNFLCRDFPGLRAACSCSSNSFRIASWIVGSTSSRAQSLLSRDFSCTKLDIWYSLNLSIYFGMANPGNPSFVSASFTNCCAAGTSRWPEGELPDAVPTPISTSCTSWEYF